MYATLGVLGSGYFLCKLYGYLKRHAADRERALAIQRNNEELIKAQMQEHFEKIQKIADSTTLPHVMQYLNSRIAEELNLMPLTERLMKGKGEPNTLTAAEKLELWDRLKILSFTRMVLSLWTMTILNLFVRVQVNILGRHLYIGTARGVGSSHLLEEADLIEQTGEQQFLAAADFLTTDAFPKLISSLEAATFQVLKGKQLKDLFDATVLHETLFNILHAFVNTGRPNQWISYLMSEDLLFYKHDPASDCGSQDPSLPSKFDQLMMETRAVISSAEFSDVLDVSLKVIVDALVKEIDFQPEKSGLTSGMMPLAKLVPRIAHICQLMVEEPNRERYIQIINKSPQVEQFFTLLYSACLLP